MFPLIKTGGLTPSMITEYYSWPYPDRPINGKFISPQSKKYQEWHQSFFNSPAPDKKQQFLNKLKGYLTDPARLLIPYDIPKYDRDAYMDLTKSRNNYKFRDLYYPGDNTRPDEYQMHSMVNMLRKRIFEDAIGDGKYPASKAELEKIINSYLTEKQGRLQEIIEDLEETMRNDPRPERKDGDFNEDRPNVDPVRLHLYDTRNALQHAYPDRRPLDDDYIDHIMGESYLEKLKHALINLSDNRTNSNNYQDYYQDSYPDNNYL